MRSSTTILLVISTIAVSSAAVFIVLSGFDAESIAFWRLAATTAAFAPLAWPRMPGVWRRLSVGARLALLAAGVGYGLHFVWWPMGFERTSYESTVVLLAAQPVFACLLAVPLLGETVTRRMWGSIAVAAIGLGVLVAEDYAFRPEHLVGDAIVLGSVVAIVVTSLAGRRLRQEMDFVVYAGAISGIATVTAVAALWVGEGRPLSTTAGVAGWWALAGLVLIPTLLGHAGFLYLVKEVPVFYLNLVIVAEPVIAISMKYALRARFPVFQDSHLGPVQLVGGGLLLAGVFVGLRSDTEFPAQPQASPSRDR